MLLDWSSGLEFQMFRYVWNLQKKKSIFVSFATLGGAAAEALGLAMISLLMSFMLGNNAAISNIDLLKNLNLDIENASSYFITGFLAVFFAKTLLLSFIVWIQSKYIYSTKNILSQNLFSIYLNESYEKSVKSKSNKKVSNLTVEMHAFVVNYLFPMLLLVTELLVVVAMLLVAFIIEPMAALSAIAVIAVSMFAIDFFTRHKLKSWGAERVSGEAEKVQSAQQAFDTFKEIKIGNTSAFFDRTFAGRLGYLQSVETKELALSQMPRLWLEAVAVLALAAVLAVSTSSTEGPEKSIATAGLFALLAFRLMPSANRIIVSIQKIRYSYSTIQLLLEIISKKESEEHQIEVKAEFDPHWKTINLNNVGYRYKNEAHSSIEHISFTVKRGECIGIVGPSGVGKSTLLDIMLSLLPPSEGSISLDDQPLSRVASAWRQACGYVPQSPLLVAGTVSTNVAFGIEKSLIDTERVDIALEQAGLPEYIGKSAKKIGERGNTLSGGQRQRISIARTLYRNPDILFFDEATSALDQASGLKLIDTVAKLKGSKTIILVTHQEYPLKVCDKILRLSKGSKLEIEDRGFRDKSE